MFQYNTVPNEVKAPERQFDGLPTAACVHGYRLAMAFTSIDLIGSYPIQESDQSPRSSHPRIDSYRPTTAPPAPASRVRTPAGPPRLLAAGPGTSPTARSPRTPPKPHERERPSP